VSVHGNQPRIGFRHPHRSHAHCGADSDRHGTDVRGLTTAATIWVVAAMGMVVGFGNYKIAIFTTVLVLVTLVAIRPLERRMFHRQEGRHMEEDHFS